MDARSTYDRIIAEIEEKANDRNIEKSKILYSVARTNGISEVDLNIILRFMTGKTAINYISSRKMMAAYRIIIESKNRKNSAAVDISGLGADSSFDKKFRAIFNMTPSEAFRKKDRSLLESAPTWEILSGNTLRSFAEQTEDEAKMQHVPHTRETFLEEVRVSMKNPDMRELILGIVNRANMPGLEAGQGAAHTVFGIPEAKYKIIKRILDLQGVYDLPEMYGELVYELSEKYGYSLEDGFRYAASLYDYGGNYMDTDEPAADQDPENELRADAFDRYLLHMFFKHGISVSAAMELVDRLPLCRKKIIEEDPDLLRAYCLCGDIDYNYFKRAYEYYERNKTDKHSAEDFCHYLDRLHTGIPFEVAFEFIPSGCFIPD